jgi:hypothetical protein
MGSVLYYLKTAPEIFIPSSGVGIVRIDVIGGGASGSKGDATGTGNARGGGGGGSGLYITYEPDVPITGAIDIVYVGKKGVKGSGTSTRIHIQDTQTTIEAGGGYSNYGRPNNTNGARGGDQFITNNLAGTIKTMISSGGGAGSNGFYGGLGFNGENNGQPGDHTLIKGGNGGGDSNIMTGNGLGGSSSNITGGAGGGGGGILPTVLSDTGKSQGRNASLFSNIATGLNYGSGGGGGNTFVRTSSEPGDGAPGAVILYYKIL